MGPLYLSTNRWNKRGLMRAVINLNNNNNTYYPCDNVDMLDN